MPRLDLMIEELKPQLKGELRETVASSLELLATSQFEKEPEALYSGLEVAESLREYARAIRDMDKFH